MEKILKIWFCIYNFTNVYKEEVDNYDVSRFEIVKLDKEAHIIKDKKSGVTGINFWKDSPTKELGIKAYSTLSVLLNDNDEFLELWVSDPTQLANYKSVLEVDGKYEVSTNLQ